MGWQAEAEAEDKADYVRVWRFRRIDKERETKRDAERRRTLRD